MARQAISEDFAEFDYVLAMDRDNYRGLKAICLPGYEERLHMFMDFAPELGIKEVPDPYYGGPQGFEDVFDMVSAASRGLLDHIRHQHGI
jgi:protein-tyrosine phosphatase